MTRIAMTEPAQAAPDAEAILDEVRKTFGTVPNIFRLLATAPAALTAYASSAQALEAGTLDARSRELIAVAVASYNGCDYCLAAHAAGGRVAGLSDDELQAATRFEAHAARDAQILALTREVIETAGEVTDARIEQARAAGLTDAAILEVLAHIALNQMTNMANRLAQTPIDMPNHTLTPQGRPI